jgi:hypothetical protein
MSTRPDSCCAGNVDCLNYVLDRGCALDDDYVKTTVMSGEVDSVKVMVARGFPHKPFDMELIHGEGARFSPAQVRCMEHRLATGMCPSTTQTQEKVLKWKYTI